VGVSGGDTATPNLILGGNSVEVIVTDYKSKCSEEGSSNELVVELQGYISVPVIRHARLPAGNKLGAPAITAPDKADMQVYIIV
jgi:hypothetical protein